MIHIGRWCIVILAAQAILANPSFAYDRKSAGYVTSSKDKGVLDYIVCLERVVADTPKRMSTEASLDHAEAKCRTSAAKLGRSGSEPNSEDIRAMILECGFRLEEASPDQECGASDEEQVQAPAPTVATASQGRETPIAAPKAPRVQEVQQSVEKASDSPATMWVKVDYSPRKTCPSANCGTVGMVAFRENATVIETQGEWVRITRYYDASCKDGRSQYVKQGNSSCSENNGIVRGQLAEWVMKSALSTVRPADPGANASGVAALVRGSSDFHRYEKQFVAAAQRLMAEGTCREKDFVEMGGFTKSSSSPGVYFTYCGGMTLNNRLYLEVATGRIYR